MRKPSHTCAISVPGSSEDKQTRAAASLRGTQRYAIMADIHKHLERAKRYLEKNKLRDALEEYQSVLELEPSHPEALQALADIYTRLNEPQKAGHFYGLQFDRLVEAGDAAKASAIYSHFLRTVAQPPERLQRHAALLHRQSKFADAMEFYAEAAQRFRESEQPGEAIECLEKAALLDPENPARFLELAAMAEQSAIVDPAARAYLRAGQLVLAQGDLDNALQYLSDAHRLAPADRSAALLYADARLRKGDAAGAVFLLEPFSPSEADTTFLFVFGDALLQAGRLDQARQVLEAYYRQKPDSFAKLFELADAYLKVSADEKAVAVLHQTKEWMRGLRRENEFAISLDRLCALHPASLRLAELAAQFCDELNRETKYFDALVRLFDLYLESGDITSACNTLDRLIDIDPYDYRNQQRISLLEGKADPAYLEAVAGRAAKAATIFRRAEDLPSEEESQQTAVSSPEHRAQQALDDLVVQVEIFLQYSLQAKAIERLQRIAEMFPGEELTNDRLLALYERANWWPQGAPPRPKPGAGRSASSMSSGAPVPATPAPDTHRDLAAIAEITRVLYRQPTLREILAAGVQEIGKYLQVTRCLAAMGPEGDIAQLSAEYCSPGTAPVTVEKMSALLMQVTKQAPNAHGAVEMHSSTVAGLRDLSLAAALGVPLTDKQTQEPAGVLLAGQACERNWKPNEAFFLQSLGDQIVLCVNHTRLRSLVRTLAVADEKTGLLSRGAYLDCLLTETNRAKSHSMPLSLVILQIDRGSELLRHHGDAALERYLEQLARSIEPSIRQTDLAVRYTAWSIAFILPDTGAENARILANKVRQVALGVKPPWGDVPNFSAIISEISRRNSDEAEDRVTEWVNRAEFGLDEARRQGGDLILALATPDL